MTESSKSNSAIGLLYEAGHSPIVSAKGFGELADEIIALAKEKGILIHQDEALANRVVLCYC